MDFKFVYFVYFMFYIQSTKAIGEDAILLSVFKEGNLPGNLTQISGDLDTRLTSVSGITGQTHTFLNSDLRIMSIACAQGNDTSFLYEVSTKSIYRLEPTSGSSMRYYVLHSGISLVEGEITYDWLNRNLYWTDGKFQWIILQPAYALENAMYTVVVDRNLTMPYAITVDPNKGFLFWSDIATNPVIERSNLAGNNREAIVTKSLSFPNSLVADETTESLFWVDHIRDTIETCSYSGVNRRLLRRLSSTQFTSLALYKDILCVSDAKHKRFTCHRKTSGDDTLQIQGFKGTTWALALYDSTNRSIPSTPCQSKSCEHICVAAVGGVAECICKEGFTLNQDGRTCSHVHGLYGKGVLISNNTYICMLEVRIMSQFDHEPLCIFSKVGAKITHLETDTNRSLIFFSDDAQKEILIHNRINQANSTLTSTSTVSGLAYDWINENLFWTESDTGRVKVVSLTTRSSLIVFNGLSSPKELTINPHNSTLYWVENDTSGKKIQSGKTDGTQKQTVISGSFSSAPYGLYFNTLTNRLYWENSGALRSSLGNGTNIKSHFSIGSAKHLSIYKGYVIWTTATPDTRSSRLSSSGTEFIKPLSLFGSITGMVMFDPSIQRTEKGPCEDANGGCQEICVATQPGRTCQCSLGFTLQSDQTSCSSTPIYNDFLLTTDNSHNKVYQISLVNNNVTALDLPNLNSAVGIAYNSKTKMVVWSEIQTGQIRQSLLTGENSSIIFSLGFAFADRLAIDFSTNNIYFSQISHLGVGGSIRVVRDGVSAKTIVPSMSSPRAIALYPSKGYLFFTDHQTISSHISRCNMDGSSKTTLVSVSTKWPNGLALDYATDRLYWTDGYHNKIESTDLNGGDRREILTESSSHMMSIIVGGPYIYYTAWSKQIITKVNKNTNQQETWMEHNAEFGRLDSLDIYMGRTHPVNSLCSSQNGQCSTYCLPTTTGRTCSCEDGVTLQSDGRTCQGVTQCSSSIPNGFLNSNCLRYAGLKCDYYCSSTYQKNASIQDITCERTGSWNMPLQYLCNPIKCDMAIPNGTFTSNCDGSLNNFCQYNCDTGYQANPSYSNILCSMPGIWSPLTDQLCSRIQCPSSIPNGGLSSCNRYVGDVCSYQCNNGYRQNTSISSLTCLATGQWNVQVDTICQEIKCPTNIPNGTLQNCQANIGSSCNFLCDHGFHKKSGVTSIACLATGFWSNEIDELCVQTMCDTSISNVEFINGCTGMVNTSCQYQCKAGSRKQTNLSSIHCQQNGQWNHNVDGLCVLSKCNTHILNGQIDQPCSGFLLEKCSYTCNDGYIKDHAVKSITCKSNNEWSARTENLCKEEGNVLPITGIGGGAGGGVGLIIILVIVIVVICKRKQKKKDPYSEMLECSDPSNNPYGRPISEGVYADIDDIDNQRESTYNKPYDDHTAVTNNKLVVDTRIEKTNYAYTDPDYLHPKVSRNTTWNQYENPAFLDGGVNFDYINSFKMRKETDVPDHTDLPIEESKYSDQNTTYHSLDPMQKNYPSPPNKTVPPPVPLKPSRPDLPFESPYEKHTKFTTDDNYDYTKLKRKY